MEVLGVIMKVAGEVSLLRWLPKVDPKQAGAKTQGAEQIDPIKMAKIKEFAENVVVVKHSSIPMPAGAEKVIPRGVSTKKKFESFDCQASSKPLRSMGKGRVCDSFFNSVRKRFAVDGEDFMILFQIGSRSFYELREILFLIFYSFVARRHRLAI